MECSKNSPTRDIHSDIGLPQETEKNLKQPNLPLKGIRKRTIKAQSQQEKRNNKDQEEIKENNNNKCSIKRSMKPRLFKKLILELIYNVLIFVLHQNDSVIHAYIYICVCVYIYIFYIITGY